MTEDGMQIICYPSRCRCLGRFNLIFGRQVQVLQLPGMCYETDASGLKQGNYVRNALLVLRKQTSEETVYRDELIQKLIGKKTD